MPLVRIDDYDTEPTGGFRKSLFYNLRVNADNGCKKKKWEKENGKTISGYYEDGWFLGRFKDAVLVSYHNYDTGSSNEKFLCTKSFESEGERKHCPMCEEYYNSKKNSRYSYRHQALVLPFLAVKKQEQWQLSNNEKNLIVPIYWFEMTVTSFRDDYKANYLRLRDCNEKYPIQKYPYRIFAKKRGENEIQEWYFKALKETDEHNITLEHPLIDEWFDENKGKWLFNRDYQELLSALTIVRYKQYVNPNTHEVEEYEGEYENAVAIYEDIIERYGEATTPLDEDEYDNYNRDNEEDEELD